MTKHKTSKVPTIRFKDFGEEWAVAKVRDVCSISTGKSNTQDRVAGGQYPFYVRSSTIERSNRYLYDEEAVLTVGDGVGTGKIYHYVNGKYDLHQRVYRMFAFEEGLYGRFFYYFFAKNFYSRVMARTAKTSVDSVRLEMIAGMDIRFPSKLEQSSVATFFAELDRLIELQQRKHDKLVTLKKAMLQKMFPQPGATTPEIRFSAFSGKWRLKAVSSLLTERNVQSPKSEQYPLMAFIAGQGVAPKGERYNREFLVTDEANKNYKQTEFGDFIYSSNNLETGSIGLNRYGKASISPVYSIFAPTLEGDSDFIGQLLCQKAFIQRMVKWRQGVVYGQWRIHESDFLKLETTFPSVEEQKKIGTYFRTLDELISKHAVQLEKLKQIKSACLEKMFV